MAPGAATQRLRDDLDSDSDADAVCSAVRQPGLFAVTDLGRPYERAECMGTV